MKNMMKICTKCSVKQNDDNFYKNSSCCKNCTKKHKKQYYEDNKERIKKSRENNKGQRKICSKCKIEQNDDDFNKNQSWCKNCNKEYSKLYRKENKEQIKEARKQWYENNKGQRKICSKCKIEKEDGAFSKNQNRCKDCGKEYRSDNKEKMKESRENNKEKIKESKKNYNKRHRKEINQKQNQRRLIDPFYKLRCLVSGSIGKQLKRYNSNKIAQSSSKYINIKELRIYIESKFESWMNWSNHGNYNPDTWDDNNIATWTWQIDHIIPQSLLSYDSMDHPNFKKCWAFENLRPYSSKQNILDGNRLADKGA